MLRQTSWMKSSWLGSWLFFTCQLASLCRWGLRDSSLSLKQGWACTYQGSIFREFTSNLGSSCPLNPELKHWTEGIIKCKLHIKTNLTSPQLSTSSRGTLAPCSPTITDNLAVCATCWDDNLQPELLPWLSVSCSAVSLSWGSRIHFLYSWTSALWSMALSEVAETQKSSWTLCCQCSAMGFPSGRGVVGNPLQLGGTPSQVQGGLWQSPWPGYCAGPRTELRFGFSILTQPVWGDGSTGEILRNLEWSSWPLFSSTRENKKCLVWTLREFPSAPLNLAMMWQSGMFVWRLLPWPVFLASLVP